MKTCLAFGLFMMMTTAAVAAEPTATLHQRNRNKQSAKEMTVADHKAIANRYLDDADQNRAQAAAYEQAAARYRRGPFVKNLMAASTSGRYEFIAQEYRDKAKADRLLAESHEQMAKASAGF